MGQCTCQHYNFPSTNSLTSIQCLPEKQQKQLAQIEEKNTENKKQYSPGDSEDSWMQNLDSKEAQTLKQDFTVHGQSEVISLESNQRTPVKENGTDNKQQNSYKIVVTSDSNITECFVFRGQRQQNCVNSPRIAKQQQYVKHETFSPKTEGQKQVSPELDCNQKEFSQDQSTDVRTFYSFYQSIQQRNLNQNSNNNKKSAWKSALSISSVASTPIQWELGFNNLTEFQSSTIVEHQKRQLQTKMNTRKELSQFLRLNWIVYMNLLKAWERTKEQQNKLQTINFYWNDELFGEIPDERELMLQLFDNQEFFTQQQLIQYIKFYSHLQLILRDTMLNSKLTYEQKILKLQSQIKLKGELIVQKIQEYIWDYIFNKVLDNNKKMEYQLVKEIESDTGLNFLMIIRPNVYQYICAKLKSKYERNLKEKQF